VNSDHKPKAVSVWPNLLGFVYNVVKKTFFDGEICHEIFKKYLGFKKYFKVQNCYVFLRKLQEANV